MISKVVMPKTGQTMETGTIVSWRAKVGDLVKKGDILLEIETDKTTLEIDSFHTGQLKAIVVNEGEEAPIEAVIALIGDEADTVDEKMLADIKNPSASQTPAPETSQAASTQTTAAPSAAPPRKGKIKISPRAKKLAEKLGVDTSTITGTGPGGRILEKDVQQAAGSTPAPSAAPVAGLGELIKFNRMRKLTAEKMIQSKKEIPCFYLNVKADVTNLFDRRQKDNLTAQTKISFNDYVIEAIGKALVKYPEMTGQWTGDGIQLAQSFGVGLAIASTVGLVAPVVQNVDQKSVEQIATDTRALIENANASQLKPDDLKNASITLTNLGMMGIDEFIPIVVPGQASILGIGRITDQYVPKMGTIATRKIMSMTLSVDHRVVDGAYASEFLSTIVALIS